MSGRDEGYYGPSTSDLNRGALVLGALAAAGVALAAALCIAFPDGGDAAWEGPACCAACGFNDDERDDYEA